MMEIREYSTKHSGIFLLPERMLYSEESPFQRIEVFDHKFFGRVLRLDDRLQTSEQDEFIYHEMIVHVPMLRHRDPKKVLIIGGGDGGALEEVLKHPSVEKVDLVELDEQVISVSRNYLHEIHKNSFDDPRVNVMIADGLEYARTTRERYDVVILDLTDSEGATVELYSVESLRTFQNLLTSEGVMSLHVGWPYENQVGFANAFESVTASTSHVKLHHAYIPLYATELWFACVSKTYPKDQTKDDVNITLKERGLYDLKYIDGDVFFSSQTGPPFIQKLIKTKIKGENI